MSLKSISLGLCALFISALQTAAALPLQETSRAVNPELPRLVIYFQTTHDAASGRPISMLDLITEKGIALTHLIICSFHLGNQDSDGQIHLNDYRPDHPLFYTLWNETVIMREAGVKVMGMVGGAAPGSFSTATLDSPDPATFEHYYGQLHDTSVKYNLQGMDVDVEQDMSQYGITRLLKRLNTDFGDDFIITLAPVASALYGGPNLSGFHYPSLAEEAVTSAGKPTIDFLNAQFYNGFGDLDSPVDFESAVAAGWNASDIVAGQLTDAGRGGSAYFSALNQTVAKLVRKYGTFGGIMGWEYFNSAPGGVAAPWEWAQTMTKILRPSYAVPLVITHEIASVLDRAHKDSLKPTTGPDVAVKEQSIDYFAMVNA